MNHQGPKDGVHPISRDNEVEKVMCGSDVDVESDLTHSPHGFARCCSWAQGDDRQFVDKSCSHLQEQQNNVCVPVEFANRSDMQVIDEVGFYLFPAMAFVRKERIFIVVSDMFSLPAACDFSSRTFSGFLCV